MNCMVFLRQCFSRRIVYNALNNFHKVISLFCANHKGTSGFRNVSGPYEMKFSIFKQFVLIEVVAHCHDIALDENS